MAAKRSRRAAEPPGAAADAAAGGAADAAAGGADDAAAADLQRRARQFLVHSFLYYRLGESVLSDPAFDQIAEALNRLREAHPDVALPFAEVLAPALGAEGSGFLIRSYPPEIVSAAFKLLYAVTQPQLEFREFVERRGYAVDWEPAA